MATEVTETGSIHHDSRPDSEVSLAELRKRLEGAKGSFAYHTREVVTAAARVEELRALIADRADKSSS